MKKKILITAFYCLSSAYGCERKIAAYKFNQPTPSFEEAICLAEKNTRTKWVSDSRAAQRICCLNSSCGSILQGFYWIAKAGILTGVTAYLHSGGVIDNGEVDTALATISYATLSATAGYGLKKIYAGCMNQPAKQEALLSEKHWNKFVKKRLKIETLEEIRTKDNNDLDQDSADDIQEEMKELSLEDPSEEEEDL